MCYHACLILVCSYQFGSILQWLKCGEAADINLIHTYYTDCSMPWPWVRVYSTKNYANFCTALQLNLWKKLGMKYTYPYVYRACLILVCSYQFWSIPEWLKCGEAVDINQIYIQIVRCELECTAHRTAQILYAAATWFVEENWVWNAVQTIGVIKIPLNSCL